MKFQKILLVLSIGILSVTTVTAQESEYAAAMAAYDNKNYDEAIKIGQKGLEKDPNDGELFSLLGSCYDEKKDYNAALENYMSAIRNGASSPEKLWFNASLAFSEVGKDAKALEACQKALAIKSDYSRAQSRLILLQQKAANQAPDAKSDNDMLYVEALALYKKNQFQASLEKIEESIAILPAAKKSYLKGLCYKKLEQAEKAILAYEDALKMEPNHADALQGLGSVHYNQGAYEKSFAYFEKALVEKPTDLTLQEYAGRALYQQKKYKDCIPYLEKVAEGDMSRAKSISFLYKAYNETNQIEKAKTLAEKAKTKGIDLEKPTKTPAAKSTTSGEK